MRKTGITKLLWIAALAIALAGCGTKGDDGDIFAIIDGWTSDINALDLSGVGATSSGGVYFKNTKYKLKAGTGTVAWRSNSTVYSVTVDPEPNSGDAAPLFGKGKSGDEKDYHLFFSFNVMTVTSNAAPPGIQPADQSASPAQQQVPAEVIMGAAEAGQIKELDPQ